jgi:NAD(P)-dependent dehydrogenase (short-subunit alcohol dehydrogenase family)
VQMAGVLLVAGFDDTTPAEFARVLQVNLLGQVHGAKAALPHLRRGGGAFISMSSMGSQRGLPLQTAYCSSKHQRKRQLSRVARFDQFSLVW